MLFAGLQLQVTLRLEVCKPWVCKLAFINLQSLAFHTPELECQSDDFHLLGTATPKHFPNATTPFNLIISLASNS